MFANALTFFWPQMEAVEVEDRPPIKRHAPVFVGDAVQPWAGETLLLTLLREAALRDLDQEE